jgi:predicted regulator of Ras-like GTPase activity (Roadblock/LC7/MglB family)
MAGLPQLIEDDVRVVEAALDELLRRSEASSALVIDKGGPLISQRGETHKFDATTVAALAAGAFSLLISNVDDNLLLIVVFPAETGVGAVKYYAADAVARLSAQMQNAAQRAPGPGLDLVSLNTLDISQVFRKRE